MQAKYYDASPVSSRRTIRKWAIPKPGRNDPCPCGSGKKYKRCCIDREGFYHEPERK